MRVARCILQPLHDQAHLRVCHALDHSRIKSLILQLGPYRIGARLRQRFGNANPILPFVGRRRRSQPT